MSGLDNHNFTSNGDKDPDLEQIDEIEDDEDATEAYCVRCRETVEMLDPQPVWTSKGTPGTRGTCPECGSTVFRMGRTAAHDALNRPAAVRVESQTKIATSGRRRAQPATYVNFIASDADFARQLSTELQNAGIHTWVDGGDTLTADVKWAGGVHPALRDSARMLVVLSAAALNDPVFKQAWEFFKQQKKPITLAVVGGETTPIPDALRRSPRFYFSPNQAEHQKTFRQLVSALSE